MGKRIEDLPLDDTPIVPEPSPPATDPRGIIWYRFSQEIDELLSGGQYGWAEDTLRGIQETVERTKTVTDGQRRAVANIEASRHGDRGRARSRRYEGYR